MPKRYAAEPVVIRDAELVFSVNPDGTGFRQQTFSVAIQSEAILRTFSVLGVPFAGNSEHVTFVYARVRHPDGSTVSTPLDTAMEQPDQVTREAPLYSDLKQEQLPIKGLGVGDTLEWQVRIDRTKPEAQGQFWGRQNLFNDGPVLAESIELRLPAKVTATVWTNPDLKLQPAVAVQGESRVYRWTSSSSVTTVGPEAEAAKKAKEKTVVTAAEQIDLRQGKLPDIAWTSFSSWDGLGAWYRSLESGRLEPTPEITAKVHELTDSKATLEDKVHAVYAYVSGQIHYIGVDFGIGRYQPHQAATVLENQYGDCKDKHTLLAAMLAVLGVHADAVLIGSGIRFNPAVPAPDSFNHVITHVVFDKEHGAWLDATTEVAPYGMLFATLRDKDALVVHQDHTSTVEHTPVDPPFPTFENMTAVGSLDKDGVSESHFTLEQRGDEELLVRMVLRQINAGQYDELTQRLVANLGFGGTVSHARFEHVEDPSKPLLMEWDYRREQAGGDWGNLRTVPQFTMVLLPTVSDTEPPIQDILLLGAREVTSTSELKIPAGWSAEMPEAVHAKSAYGTYDMTFRYKDGTLYGERHWTVLKSDIPQADWKLYKKWLDAINPTSEPYIQLRKASASAKESASAPKTSAAGDVGAGTAESVSHLIDQAYAAVQNNQLAEAQTLLDRAKALDPNARSLWGDYGWIAWKRGEHLEAMRFYRKETSAHPESHWAFLSLSQLQFLTGDQDGAAATLREYERQAPDSAEAVATLLDLLVRTQQYAAASKEAAAALVRLPDEAKADQRLQLALMVTQLHSPTPEAGARTASALLTSTTDPQILNSVAYELALSRQDLPLAEKTERDVLDKLTAESQTWTLDESWERLRQRSELITASWDTMGWILFAEGRPAEALPYIQARWRNSATAEVGEHLGDVQSALQQPAAALQSYRQALATISPFDAFGVRRKDKTPLERRLAEKITALGGHPAEEGNRQLQQARTVHLPSALGHDGTVEYKLLASSAGIVRAEPSGDRNLAGGAELIHRAQLPVELFPPHSTAQLVHGATLNCVNGQCDLIMHP